MIGRVAPRGDKPPYPLRAKLMDTAPPKCEDVRTMDVNQIKEWILAGQTDEVEIAWMTAADSQPGIAVKQAGEILSALAAAKKDDLADTLGWTLLEERKERDTPEQRLELAKTMAMAVPLSGDLRQQALAIYRDLFGTHRHFDGLVKASDINNAPTPRRAFATLDLCLRLTDNGYVSNRFRNQVAQIKQFDDVLNEYELEDLADGKMTIEPRRLADEFELIGETDFRVLSKRDPSRLGQMFFDDPATVLIGVCQAHEGRIDSIDLKEMLVPRYIPAPKWSGWWNKARTAAKRCDKLAVEGRNPVALVYHPQGLTLEDELKKEVESARTPQETLELLRRYAREARQRKVDIDPAFASTMVDTLAEQASSFQQARPTDAITASLGIDVAAKLGIAAPERAFPSPKEILAATADAVKVVSALEDDTLWLPAMKAISELPNGADLLENLLTVAPTRQLNTLAKLLDKAGRQQAIADVAAKALADPLGNLDLMLWLWSDPADGAPDPASKLEILSKLLKILHDLDIDPHLAESVDRKEYQLRIRTALGARDLAGFREVVAGMDEAMASIIRSRIERTDGLAQSVRDDMIAILRENFYGLFAKKRVEPWLDDTTLYTTQAGLRLQEAELKDLIENQILANSRAIGAAAELGDLSENSEWKFAVEERTKLQGRQAKIQDDLTKARVMHPEEVSANMVNIGTKVTLRRTSGDGQIDVTILGPWDTDLDRRHYSYQTTMAQSLLGKSVGDSATLRIEGDETDYEIVEIGVGDF